MAELDRLIYRYGQEKVEKCAKAWEFLMEAMQGHPVEERMHASGSVEGVWQAVMTWYQPRGDAERDHLEDDFDNIAMQGDEDPKLFFARVEGKLNVLASLGILKSDREVVRLITRRLPSEFYDVEQRTTLIMPGMTHSEMVEIVRASYANGKTRWRSGSWRRSCQQQRRRWTRTLSPWTVVFRAITGGGRFGGAGQQLQQRQYDGAGEQQQPQQQRQFGGAGQ